MIDRSYLGVDPPEDLQYQTTETSVPDLDEIESEREFATHIMFYGYSKDDIERLSDQQRLWLIRWG